MKRGVGVDYSDQEIYEKNAPDLVRYATVLVGPDQAPDVVSTVVLRVLRRRSLADLDDARAYLFRAVLNESRSWGRRRKTNRVVLAQLLEREASGAFEAELADRLDATEAVWKLSPRHRSAAYLVYWLDLPIAEAARLLNVSPGTVKRYIHEVREKIREELQ